MGDNNAPREAVVLVHGFAMTGLVMAPLALRLRRCNFSPCRFSYPDVRATIGENALRLRQFAASVPAEKIHLVGHSLGGLVILRMLADDADPRTGRIVLLGTPYQGSHVARILSRSAMTRWMLGRSIRHGMLCDRPQWAGPHELGVIAGSRQFGAGRLIPGLPNPNDGMVALEETRVPGARDHVILHVSHSEMLISGAVANQVCAFLKNGYFNK